MDQYKFAKHLFRYEDVEAFNGVIGALRRFRPVEAARIAYWWLVKEGYRLSPVRWYEAYQDRAFDARYGTDTRVRVDLPNLTVVGPNLYHGVFYQASPVVRTRSVISGLGIDYRQYVFIDFGSGKGRVLLLASELPFKEVIGIEFGRELHEIAERNIAVYPKKTSSSVRSVHMDATEYVLPDENLVLYFYNPFDEGILSQILENVRQASETYGRSIYIIYHFLPSQENLKNLPNFACLNHSRKYYVYSNGKG